MDENDKEQFEILKKFGLHLILPLYSLYFFLYSIWVFIENMNNQIVFSIIIILGIPIGLLMNFVFIFFLLYECTYHLKLKIAILVDIFVIIFLPIILYFALDPTLSVLKGTSGLFIFSHLLGNYCLIYLFLPEFIPYGYIDAIKKGKYDYKIKQNQNGEINSEKDNV